MNRAENIGLNFWSSLKRQKRFSGVRNRADKGWVIKRAHHKHMKLFINILIKRIYLFYTVGWNYTKKREFSVWKKENSAGLRAHRRRGKSTRASPSKSIEERSARFIAQTLSALVRSSNLKWPLPVLLLLRAGRAGDWDKILWSLAVSG